MKILITGGTGFIGRPLCLELTQKGHELTLQSRNPEAYQTNWGLPSHFLKWDMEHEDCPIPLDTFDAVIHLAGASIAGGRWTTKQKAAILESRVKSTRALGKALSKRSRALPCFISAAAIGFYGSDSKQSFDESSPAGQGFLADVCTAWESAVASLPHVTREVRLRFGLVLGDGGGVLGKLILPTRCGLSAILGDGQQWISWIHRNDIIAVIEEALSNTNYYGPINLVAPEALPQAAFQKCLARLLGAPLFLKAPRPLLKALLGEFSQLLLDSQRVVPQRLLQLHYRFQFPTLDAALIEATNLKEKDGKMLLCHRLEAAQYVARPRNEVFSFFSDPYNLEKITPPLLNFKIKQVSTQTIEKLTVIDYRLKVHGLPFQWKTLIEDWQEGVLFIDNQERGPYKVWHHTHAFYTLSGGTLMTDRVLYRLPFGLLGDLVALPLVKHDVQKIFAYRRNIIEDQFRSV